MVSGTHYQQGTQQIQPLEFYASNPQLDFQQCNMIKYAYRHKNKNGIHDLLKVVHYALIEVGFEYPENYDEFKGMIKGLLND